MEVSLIHALLSGALFRAAETRTGKASTFAKATIRWIEDGHPQYATVLAFDDEARTTLMDLAKGDALTVTGRLERELFEKEGQPPRVALKIIADRILPLKPREKTAPTITKGKSYGRPNFGR